MDIDLSGWREHKHDGLMGTLGPLLSRQIAGRWQYGLMMRDAHLNAAKMVHGGAITTLMDQALSALAWQHTSHTPCLTMQLNINFIDAARLGDFMIASGRVVRATRSLLFLDGEICVADGTIATAQGIFKPVRGPASGE
ncbi:PaaI family thioesterase [Paralcaligenes ginsengisoli]